MLGNRPWWPATFTDAVDRPWRKKDQGQWTYNCEFLGHGSEERADYEYLPLKQLRPYNRHDSPLLLPRMSSGG